MYKTSLNRFCSFVKYYKRIIWFIIYIIPTLLNTTLNIMFSSFTNIMRAERKSVYIFNSLSRGFDKTLDEILDLKVIDSEGNFHPNRFSKDTIIDYNNNIDINALFGMIDKLPEINSNIVKDIVKRIIKYLSDAKHLTFDSDKNIPLMGKDTYLMSNTITNIELISSKISKLDSNIHVLLEVLGASKYFADNPIVFDGRKNMSFYRMLYILNAHFSNKLKLLTLAKGKNLINEEIKDLEDPFDKSQDTINATLVLIHPKYNSYSPEDHRLFSYFQRVLIIDAPIYRDNNLWDKLRINKHLNRGNSNKKEKIFSKFFQMQGNNKYDKYTQNVIYYEI